VAQAITASESWRYECPERIVRLRTAKQTGWAILADQARNVLVLNESGRPEWQVQVDFPVEDVGASETGSVLAALLQDGTLLALGRVGAERWKVRLEGDPCCFDLGRSASWVAAGTRQETCVLYCPSTGEQRELKVGHRVASVALLESAGNELVAASESGEVSYLKPDGTVVWSHRIRSHTGRIGAASRAGFIIVPAYEEGIHTFLRDGQGAGAYDLEEHVLLTDIAQDGRIMVACTEANRVHVIDRDANILWFGDFQESVTHLALNAAADRLHLVLGGQVVVQMALTGGPKPELITGPEPEVADTVKGRIGDLDLIFEDEDEESLQLAPPVGSEDEFEVLGEAEPREAGEAAAEESSVLEMELVPDEADESDVDEEVIEVEAVEEEGEEETPREPPRPEVIVPEKGRVLWEVALGEDAKLARRRSLLSSRKGMVISLMTASGKLVAFDASGEKTGELRLNGTDARLIPHRLEKFALAWTPQELGMLDTDTGKGRRVQFGKLEPRAASCSGDLQLMALLSGEDRLCLSTLQGNILWRKRLARPSRAVWLSPKGRRLLVEDRENRFYFYDADGNLLRKVRMTGTQPYRQVILEESYVVFGGRQGRLVVLDKRGNEIWDKRVCKELRRIVPLGDHLAVLDTSGPCVVVDLYGQLTARFRVRKGRCVVTKARGQRPVLFQGEREVLTAFRPPHASVLWRHHFEDRITQMAADRDGRFLVCVAGHRLWRLTGGGEG
jgi:hypothetical protein